MIALNNTYNQTPPPCYMTFHYVDHYICYIKIVGSDNSPNNNPLLPIVLIFQSEL